MGDTGHHSIPQGIRGRFAAPPLTRLAPLRVALWGCGPTPTGHAAGPRPHSGPLARSGGTRQRWPSYFGPSAVCGLFAIALTRGCWAARRSGRPPPPLFALRFARVPPAGGPPGRWGRPAGALRASVGRPRPRSGWPRLYSWRGGSPPGGPGRFAPVGALGPPRSSLRGALRPLGGCGDLGVGCPPAVRAPPGVTQKCGKRRGLYASAGH